MQLVLFKIPEYSRQCKIPHSKIPSSTCCITQDKQSGIVFCHFWPTPIFMEVVDDHFEQLSHEMKVSISQQIKMSLICADVLSRDQLAKSP